MQPLLYVMLIAGGTLAHYRGEDYTRRDLGERNEPESDDGTQLVECPVCENGSSWLLSNEDCPIVKDGKTYKRCKYGVYNNQACGYRRDCFRGPRDRCTEKMTVDLYDQRCAAGFYCNPAMKVCTGLDYAVDSNVLWLVSPNHRYKPDHHLPASDLGYPIRARRDA